MEERPFAVYWLQCTIQRRNCLPAVMRPELMAQVNLLNNLHVFIVPLTTNSPFSLPLVKYNSLVGGR